MNARFAVDLFLLGGLVPGLITVAIALAVWRWLPRRIGRRYSAAIAIGIAFFVGYVLLPADRKADLLPSRYWHWLPYAGLTAAVIGPLACVRRLCLGERWFLFLVQSAVFAWMLVPTWPNLEPPRATYMAAATGGVFALMIALDLLASRLAPRLLLGHFFITAVFTTAAVWAGFSENAGRLGALSVACCGGAWLAALFVPSGIAARAVVPIFVTLVGGVAFIAFVYPPEPVYAVLFLPAAPIALLICGWGPLSTLQGVKGGAVQGLVLAIPILVVLVRLFI